MGKSESAFSKLKRVAADKQVASREAKAETERLNAETERAAGSLLTSGVFGTSTVEIYEGGYVRIAVGKREMSVAASITKRTPFERLRSIKYVLPASETPSNAPSGLEGAVGSAVTSLFKNGATLFKAPVPGLAAAGVAHLASAEGRRSYLTISTDKATHNLTNESSNGAMSRPNKSHNEVGAVLEAAGRSVLGLSVDNALHSFDEGPPAATVAASPAPNVSTRTVVERIREIAELHRDGILSDEEFAEAKARILTEI